MAMTRVLMKTLLGDMTLELDGEKAPATVANFVAYAEAGHYDGTIFHRVINNFMVQGVLTALCVKERPMTRSLTRRTMA